ncbi:MAG: DNA topoisomerase IB [Tatlockia sp.]|nr:DNA topoisomerase IB [Tatlockia sp.]
MNISLYSTEECEKIAESADLRYVQDSIPGILRKKQGKGFVYFSPRGTKIVDIKELERFNSIVIPPAYQNIWICPYPNGHIQATWRDNKNRKQYIYHPLWQEARQKQKFDLMIIFGESLPSIRKHINEVLSKPATLSKQQIICAILYLLDKSCIRIGNPVYAQENKTYGLTTLRKRHLTIKEDQAILDFEGKNSKVWHININNKKIVKILKKCEDIPGYELFKYKDENKDLNTISSQDINLYLKELCNNPFTAKDFRTWIASRELLYRLVQNSIDEAPLTSTKIAISEVAVLLGHTAAICKKNYLHPELLPTWEKGRLKVWIIKNKRKLIKMDKDSLLLFWLKNACPIVAKIKET